MNRIGVMPRTVTDQDGAVIAGVGEGGAVVAGVRECGAVVAGVAEGGAVITGVGEGGAVIAGVADRGTVITGVGEGGNAPLELVILAPIIVFLIGLVIAAGRTSIAQGAVAAAARDAARQASIALSASQARQVADSTARAALSGDGLRCRPVVTVNLAGFAVPAGLPAQVRATVSCTVRLSDLIVPGLPGWKTLRATFTSPLDPYRSRVLGLGDLGRSGGASPSPERA